MASATAFGREIGGVAPAGAPALVLHIPHASPVIPAEERALLVPDDRAIASFWR